MKGDPHPSLPPGVPSSGGKGKRRRRIGKTEKGSLILPCGESPRENGVLLVSEGGVGKGYSRKGKADILKRGNALVFARRKGRGGGGTEFLLKSHSTLKGGGMEGRDRGGKKDSSSL